MILTLAFRQLLVKKGRGLVLLLGFALGVGVMLVLLSVGEAMLVQSRDAKLVGGGEVTVLPQGIDVEAMRTGAISGLFFGIDRARFVTRQMAGGPRHAELIRGAAPALEQKLLYLQVRDAPPRPVRAGGELPSRAALAGAGLDVIDGRWADTPADSAWMTPTPQQLYDELDRFHLPTVDDSTWGEWHYANVVISEREWWYITYLIGGRIGRGRWGGQLLVTHRRPDGSYERFVENRDGARIVLDTTRADLVLGDDSVTQRNGRYRLVGSAGALRFDLELAPRNLAYFPAVELQDDAFLSGYVVPALAGRASGRFCVGSRCETITDRPAYHDHNWGVWRDVTWEWGAGQGAAFNLLYGGVQQAGAGQRGSAPYFLALVDSLGVRQVLRFGTIAWTGRQRAGGDGGWAPEVFDLVAVRDADTVRIIGTVRDVQATRQTAAGYSRAFLQMRAGWTLRGRIGGRAVADSGSGFFETFVR